jgi:hypothetical protein
MKRLIRTSSSGFGLMLADRAEVVVPFAFRFIWGPLPSPDELATYVAARSDHHGPGAHWSDYVGKFPGSTNKRKDFALVEFCQLYESIELWFDPNPDDQLQLIWLLDYLRSYPKIAARLKLRIVHFDLIGADTEGLRTWSVRAVDVTARELETATMVWQAYRAPTPKACFDLLGRDLTALPLLKSALLELLEELPSGTTGLGATEMRLLALVARGYTSTNELLHMQTLGQPQLFGEWETGFLLEGLAHGPRPAVRGLDDQLRTLQRQNYRARQVAYWRSRLSLTEFGEAIVVYEEDFSRHNPIDRWWGGTRLTNDRMWRWNPALIAP